MWQWSFFNDHWSLSMIIENDSVFQPLVKDHSRLQGDEKISSNKWEFEWPGDIWIALAEQELRISAPFRRSGIILEEQAIQKYKL